MLFLGEDLCFGQGYLHATGEFMAPMGDAASSRRCLIMNSRLSLRTAARLFRVLPVVDLSAERPVQIELLRLIATGKSAAVLGASMTDTDMISRQGLIGGQLVCLLEVYRMLATAGSPKREGVGFANYRVFRLSGPSSLKRRCSTSSASCLLME